MRHTFKGLLKSVILGRVCDCALELGALSSIVSSLPLPLSVSVSETRVFHFSARQTSLFRFRTFNIQLSSILIILIQ